MRKLFVVCAVIASMVGAVSHAETRVVFLAGADSHGWGKHAHHEVSELMAQCLNESGLGIAASVVYDAWPVDGAVFDGAKALVIYADGGENHLLNGHAADLAALKAKGMGLVVMHWALDVHDEEVRKVLLDWLGGYYEINWSVNPAWMLEGGTLAQHPSTRGVTDIAIEDEWYYHMRFRPEMAGVTPVLSALPPASTLAREDGPHSGNPAVRAAVEKGELQHLAWATVNADGTRGFGFSGGHYRFNLTDDAYRTLILNGIAWTAGVEIPEGGVASKKPLIPKNEFLLQAVALGDVEDVVRHLELGADINEKNNAGWTPLHYAAVRNQLEVGKALIEHGADVNAVSNRKNTALQFCAERNYPDFARLLIEHGARLNEGDEAGWTPLHTAAAKNKPEMVKLLLEAGADVMKLSVAGGTALHEAAPGASAEVVQLLLDGGVDPKVASKDGKTALDLAKEFENAEAVALLSKQ